MAEYTEFKEILYFAHTKSLSQLRPGVNMM